MVLKAVMKMKYKFSTEDSEKIKTSRGKNRDKQTDKLLQVLEMRCEGKTQRDYMMPEQTCYALQSGLECFEI